MQSYDSLIQLNLKILAKMEKLEFCFYFSKVKEKHTLNIKHNKKN